MGIELLITVAIALASGVAWVYEKFFEGKKRKRENEALKKEKKEHELRLGLLDRIMDLEFINKISVAVDRIFDKTIADRFLILVAKNGTEDFKLVSVVFEQHKNNNYRINAIATYRNVHIDNVYREMLKEAEFRGVVEMETDKMPDGILKDFYNLEGVKFSTVRHLARKPIDGNNDFVVFSSLATHQDRKFDKLESAFIKTQFEGVIMPSIAQIFDTTEDK